MTVALYIGPAGSGKTETLLQQARQAAGTLQGEVIVCVSSQAQAWAWRRRLGEAGGALGPRVVTFDQLCELCLQAAGAPCAILTDSLQYRTLRALLIEHHLTHFRPLAGAPGLVQALQELYPELLAARVEPAALQRAVAVAGGSARLNDIASVYFAYVERLKQMGWIDRANLSACTTEMLCAKAPDVARSWAMLAVDGFDSFAPGQIELLVLLSQRAQHTSVSLTGEPDGRRRPLTHQLLERTRAALEQALGVNATPVISARPGRPQALAQLETHLLATPTAPVPAGSAISMIAAPDRAGEVRAAMRWLKGHLVQDGMKPHELALLMRQAQPYRPYIASTAAEFGLPVHCLDGVPLSSSPVVAALLGLLRLTLPDPQESTELGLRYRTLVEAWRSPYLSWSTAGIPITRADADAVAAIARWGQVTGGLGQWRIALKALANADPSEAEREMLQSQGVPFGEEAQALLGKLEACVQRLTPPRSGSTATWVAWLEDLVGVRRCDDGELEGDSPASLAVRQCIADGPGELQARDDTALRSFCEQLRGLVESEQLLGTPPPASWVEMASDIMSAVEGATCHPDVQPDRSAILVANVIQARGLSFRAVAILGLAEGEFPAPQGEDPFLRDSEREELRSHFGFQLEPSASSREAGYLYEALTRARETLLLTRPRLDENGSLWAPSPYWEEVLRLVDTEPIQLTTDTPPPLEEAASWPELLEAMATHPDLTEWDWLAHEDPLRDRCFRLATQIVKDRTRLQCDSVRQQTVYNGDLRSLVDDLASRFGPDQPWSVTRLETQRTCPFMFFVQYVLGISPREDPEEGPDSAQLGTLYHEILRRVYEHESVSDRSNVEQVVRALRLVAEPILNTAPRLQRFRETAWWAHTKAEILATAEESLRALHEASHGWEPVAFERFFGHEQPLILSDGDDRLYLRGIIDRIDRLDRSPDARIRVIDYKTGGPSAYTNQAIEKGERLQLPLYALAAQEALGLGEIVDGFYWHVRHSEPSRFSLSKFPGGSEAAIARACTAAWEAVREVRSGSFEPMPPVGGCPPYCAAANFCWHLRSREGF